MKKGYKIDLHTHSIISHDGGITESEYKRLLDTHIIDVVAITDHNDIAFAQYMQKQYGERIIVGQEIMTTDGEIIGLFLTKKVLSGLSVAETIKEIKKQNGLVYIPHPFETVRHGVPEGIVQKYTKEIDIIEIYNARSLQPKTRALAADFINAEHIVGTASSDAHGLSGLGSSYAVVAAIPTHKTLQLLLKDAMLIKKRAPIQTFLYPKLNRLKKIIGLQKKTIYE